MKLLYHDEDFRLKIQTKKHFFGYCHLFLSKSFPITLRTHSTNFSGEKGSSRLINHCKDIKSTVLSTCGFLENKAQHAFFFFSE
jgi:hypothetical protein